MTTTSLLSTITTIVIEFTVAVEIEILVLLLGDLLVYWRMGSLL
jgi:hypothetical protein